MFRLSSPFNYSQSDQSPYLTPPNIQPASVPMGRFDISIYTVPPAIGQEVRLVRKLQQSLWNQLGGHENKIKQLSIVSPQAPCLRLATRVEPAVDNAAAKNQAFRTIKGMHWFTSELGMPPESAMLLADDPLDWTLVNNAMDVLTKGPSARKDGMLIAQAVAHLARHLLSHDDPADSHAVRNGVAALIRMLEQVPSAVRNPTIHAVLDPKHPLVMERFLSCAESMQDPRFHQMLRAAQQAQCDLALLGASEAAALDQLCHMAHLPPVSAPSHVCPAPTHEYPPMSLRVADGCGEAHLALPASVAGNAELTKKLLRNIEVALDHDNHGFASLTLTDSVPPFILLTTDKGCLGTTRVADSLCQNVHRLITELGMPAESAVLAAGLDLTWPNIEHGLDTLLEGPESPQQGASIALMFASFLPYLNRCANQHRQQVDGCIDALLGMFERLPDDLRNQTVHLILAKVVEPVAVDFINCISPAQHERLKKMLDQAQSAAMHLPPETARLLGRTCKIAGVEPLPITAPAIFSYASEQISTDSDSDSGSEPDSDVDYQAFTIALPPAVANDPRMITVVCKNICRVLRLNDGACEGMSVSASAPGQMELVSEDGAAKWALTVTSQILYGVELLMNRLGVLPETAADLSSLGKKWLTINAGLELIDKEPAELTNDDGKQIAHAVAELMIALADTWTYKDSDEVRQAAGKSMTALISLYEKVPADLRNRTIHHLYGMQAEYSMKNLMTCLRSLQDDRLKNMLLTAREAHRASALAEHLSTESQRQTMTLDQLCALATED